ncbi:hypothetical protein EZ428_07310 [Pedobacter frigiditerrae]|uniref:Uncharacterized protein n=1 Tax=Pedobacter frigiditerrae TaxID=2530452 RepID=A0A4R0MZX9_9SPHI|nr:hypothetical protein [Pedobacter frigiditerrae]TCC91564.1 hypothetical protein EZ428_07310 [Pedobacter frigiditerrae]
MKNNLRIALIVIMLFVTGNVFAQQTKKVELKSVAAVKTRGANPKIKVEMPTADVLATKARGGCKIIFDNYTGLYIKVYVDGYYKGTISPWGNGTVTTTDGYTSVYLVSAGGTREWNASGDCRTVWNYTLK